VSRSSGRTADCGRTDGAARLEDARAFLAVAALVLDERIPDEDEAINLSGVSAALAVLAGIAAADAACCSRLGRRYRGQDHRGAVDLVRAVVPGGPEMAKDLGRLLDLKDSAHYGVLGVSDKDARTAVERARRMVLGAKAVLTG
jgi:hypothetical protein